MLIAFSDTECLVHHEFPSRGQTMKSDSAEPFCNPFEMQFVGKDLTNGLPVPRICATTMRHETRRCVKEFISTHSIPMVLYPTCSPDTAAAGQSQTGRIGGIAACNLEGRTLKEITSSKGLFI
ncbi:hypothetical protein L798_05827 [Zootermopsis nevadensis]|uniref:Uncharacterized protein n=1 Tax=Zootermopsis nevadensis TaxID=136037 RepID=A0A067QEL1_ZOONE|nr:hypothetical protein L798_05827 [Zootermopsis nevadensis]